MPLFDRIESHASQDRLERLIEERLLPAPTPPPSTP